MFFTDVLLGDFIEADVSVMLPTSVRSLQRLCIVTSQKVLERSKYPLEISCDFENLFIGRRLNCISQCLCLADISVTSLRQVLSLLSIMILLDQTIPKILNLVSK